MQRLFSSSRNIDREVSIAEIRERAHFFPVELRGVETGARIGMPVDVPGIVARNVWAMILKVDELPAPVPGTEPSVRRRPILKGRAKRSAMARIAEPIRLPRQSSKVAIDPANLRVAKRRELLQGYLERLAELLEAIEALLDDIETGRVAESDRAVVAKRDCPGQRQRWPC